MITAWVFYTDSAGKDKLAELTGYAGFGSVVPGDWGLSDDCKVRLVMQSAQFIGAWIDGKNIKGY